MSNNKMYLKICPNYNHIFKFNLLRSIALQLKQNTYYFNELVTVAGNIFDNAFYS